MPSYTRLSPSLEEFNVHLVKKIHWCYILCPEQALRFYGSFNVTVTGITIRNSAQCHLKFDNCIGVVVHDMAVSSPGDSPNTDGIHLQNSKDVLIHGTDLACGKSRCPNPRFLPTIHKTKIYCLDLLSRSVSPRVTTSICGHTHEDARVAET